MKIIRIPRKLKKDIYVVRKLGNMFKNNDTPKILKYLSYFKIETGIKKHHLTPEELVDTYGKYMMDDVIWWYWVRQKELGIEPILDSDYQDYWDEIVK